MRIASLAPYDPAGQSWAASKAVREHTHHEMRSFAKESNFLDYPADDTAGFAEYLAGIDVAHVHVRYRSANGWASLPADVRWVMHQHSELNRMWCKGIPDEQHYAWDAEKGAVRVVSTLNLLRYVSDDLARWIPVCLHPEYLPAPNREHDGVWVAHSPTKRDVKHTANIIAAVECLRAEGLNVRLVLIEGMSWAECMAEKALCDITFDQLDLFYGMSAIEAMALGQPVIVGMSDATDALAASAFGYRPYLRANTDTLTDVLRTLVVDADMRHEYGALGAAHVSLWHSPELVASRLADIYERL